MRSELQEKRQRRELTLPKVRAAQAKTLAKWVPQKRCVGVVRGIRKETEKFGRAY